METEIFVGFGIFSSKQKLYKLTLENDSGSVIFSGSSTSQDVMLGEKFYWMNVSLREKHEKQSMPVQGKNSALDTSIAIFTMANVQNVHYGYRGRLERTVEWMSSQVAAEWCPPKNKQLADEQLSLFV
ncbi:hypothetical protein TNCV_2513151 [Trichonephila clavipes]|nr:hypothetical protein TNCV_2513151 [Trichonephila clavipes]